MNLKRFPGDDDSDAFDEEYDDYDQDDFDDETPLINCPECGEPVYDDADRCPHCGMYIIPSITNPWAGRGTWWVILGLLGIIAVLAVLTAPVWLLSMMIPNLPN